MYNNILNLFSRCIADTYTKDCICATCTCISEHEYVHVTYMYILLFNYSYTIALLYRTGFDCEYLLNAKCEFF